MLNSNILSHLAHLGDIRLQNLGDLDFYPSRSFQGKCDGDTELSIYGFLLMYKVITCLSLAI